MDVELIKVLIIAIVQGITEWVPVSSSGHNVLFESILQYEGGLMFNVALHFGTLMAVFVYFGKEITDIFQDLLGGKWKSENGRLGLLLLWATVPAGLVGYLMRDVLESVFSDLRIVALGFGITGLVLLISSLDLKKKGRKLTFTGAFMIGVAQIFALIPGVSRSGSTMSAGLLLGLREESAVKFAFLMSIPVIFGANILVVGGETLPGDLIWASLVSFFVGLGAIHILYTKLLRNKKNLRWFGVYALVLAVLVGVLG
tara:strand:- start:605 stop:1375 length:771 start_codon:yes stop_codon:yes gene_type:complete